MPTRVAAQIIPISKYNKLYSLNLSYNIDGFIILRLYFFFHLSSLVYSPDIAIRVSDKSTDFSLHINRILDCLICFEISAFL